MYFAIFYVYNALHGVTLANCSHFQYVSRSRLRVIQIGVKTCIDVTLYGEPFCHLHNRETYLSGRRLSSTSTYGTGAPLLSGKRAEGARRADRGEHAGGLP